jgi:hypothetical protein
VWIHPVKLGDRHLTTFESAGATRRVHATLSPLLRFTTVSTSSRGLSCPRLSPQGTSPQRGQIAGAIGYRSGAISLAGSALKSMSPRFADPRLTTWLCRPNAGGQSSILGRLPATRPAATQPLRKISTAPPSRAPCSGRRPHVGWLPATALPCRSKHAPDPGCTLIASNPAAPTPRRRMKEQVP